MLIVKIQINHDRLDEIFIQRISRHEDGLCEYKIIGHEDLGIIYHVYNDGYMVLLMRALETMNNVGKGVYCSDDDGDRFPIRSRSYGIGSSSAPGGADAVQSTS